MPQGMCTASSCARAFIEDLLWLCAFNPGRSSSLRCCNSCNCWPFCNLLWFALFQSSVCLKSGAGRASRRRLEARVELGPWLLPRSTKLSICTQQLGVVSCTALNNLTLPPKSVGVAARRCSDPGFATFLPGVVRGVTLEEFVIRRRGSAPSPHAIRPVSLVAALSRAESVAEPGKDLRLGP